MIFFMFKSGTLDKFLESSEKMEIINVKYIFNTTNI